MGVARLALEPVVAEVGSARCNRVVTAILLTRRSHLRALSGGGGDGGGGGGGGALNRCHPAHRPGVVEADALGASLQMAAAAAVVAVVVAAVVAAEAEAEAETEAVGLANRSLSSLSPGWR
jgi:hypothetical protein